jgi:putative tryptophan/tyrosine transport system substrate-binding protein
MRFNQVGRRKFITLIGGAAVWPFAARAQQAESVRHIGVLMGYAENDLEAKSWITGLVEGLKKLGWMEGGNVHIEYRWASGNVERLRSFTTELLGRKPDLILAGSTPALAAVHQQTSTIPIVFANVADPIGQGFVSSLAHPNGNITGFTSLEFSIAAKWIEILKEILPSLTHAALMFNPETAPYFPSFLGPIETAASSLAVKTIITPVNDAADVERAVSTFAHELNGGIIVVPSAFVTIHRQLIFEQLARYRLPAVYGFSYYAYSGGLISYGINVRDMYIRAASYIDRILKGEKPVELPIQAPTKFELVINLKTAKDLGLTVPPTLLNRADEVIE